MKILVTAKRTPDPYSKIKLKPDGSGIDTSNIKFVINSFDEIAIEEGLRKKEKFGGEVVVVSIGTQECVEQIRTALAMGADRGILVDTGGRYLDQLGVAKILARIVEDEKPDLVILGKQAIDDDANQVSQILAELLGWPQATFASKVDIDLNSKKAVVEREVDGGIEVDEVSLPAVISADLRLNQPRYASLPGIMKARQKPLKTVKIEDLKVDVSPSVEVLKFEAPPQRQGGKKVKDVDELIQALKESKVLPF